MAEDQKEETATEDIKTDNFVDSMSNLLKDTIRQHHSVNSQHDVLAELADEIKIHMDKI